MQLLIRNGKYCNIMHGGRLLQAESKKKYQNPYLYVNENKLLLLFSFEVRCSRNSIFSDVIAFAVKY